MPDPEKHTLTTCKWNGSSTVKQVELTGESAYCYAGDETGNLPGLHKAFHEKGWQTAPASRNGIPVLKLSGFSDQDELLGLLQEGGHVKGVPDINTSRIAHEKKFADKLKSSSLRASGIFYMLGNLIYIMEGIARKDKAGMGVGIAFSLGDLILAAFGQHHQEGATRTLIGKLKRHMEQSGIEIPEGAAIKAENLGKAGGFIEQVYDFMHEHVSIFKGIAELLGGASMILSGKNTERPGTKIAGGVIMAGFTASALIGEKKIDPERYKKADILEKTWMNIHANPLLIGGAAGLLNNFIGAADALSERKKLIREHGSHDIPNHYQIKLAAVASMFIANCLYSISKKSDSQGEGDNAIISDVYSMAAEVLKQLPENIREKAIEKTADFLGDRTEIRENRTQVIKKIQDEMERLAHNPWFAGKRSHLSYAAAMAR